MRSAFPLLVLLLVGCAPVFTVLDDTKVDAAAAKAEQLLVYAKTWVTRNEKPLEKIVDLSQFAEDGERAVIDPWGQKFQFCYVTDTKTQRERLVVWTTDPEGQIIAAPRQLAPLIKRPK